MGKKTPFQKRLKAFWQHFLSEKTEYNEVFARDMNEQRGFSMLLRLPLFMPLFPFSPNGMK